MRRSTWCVSLATSVILVAVIAGCGGDEFSDDDQDAWCRTVEEGIASLEADDADAEASPGDPARTSALMAELGELDWPPEIDDDFQVIREGEPNISDYESDEGAAYEADTDRYFAAGESIVTYMIDDCGLPADVVNG